MKRRDFIKLSSTASALMLLPSEVMGMLKNFNVSTCPNNTAKKLVLIQLQGANDGLNTVVPINQYDLYSNFRPNIKLNLSGANGLISLDNTLSVENQVGLHPSLKEFKNLYDKGLMRIVQGVGYPKQDKSHFKSTDLWLTGGDGNLENNNNGNGWMGRFLEKNYSSFITSNFPLGIQFGSSDNSLGLHGKEHTSLSMNLNNQDLDGYYSIVNGLSGEPPASISNSDYGDLLKYILTNDLNTNIYANSISSAFKKGTNSGTYPNTFLANQLKTVAKLISGGLESKIYLVKIGGFDTHDNQVQSGETHLGAHANLLADLSQSINAFINDINIQNFSDDIMGVTFSEFGRKIIQNGSLGTDHGEVAPLFLFGKAVNPGVSGTNINLTEATDKNNFQVNTIQHDYRQVFSTVIQDWLGADNQVVDYTFFDKTTATNFSQKKVNNIINSTSLVEPTCYSNTNPPFIEPSENNKTKIFPNPTKDILYARSNDGIKEVSLFNMNGILIRTWQYSNQPKEVTLSLASYLNGIYIIKVLNENNTQETKQIIISK